MREAGSLGRNGNFTDNIGDAAAAGVLRFAAEGVVAARAEDAAALLTAVARADLPEGAVAPGLKVGNIVDRAAVTAAVRRALDGGGRRVGESGRAM